jgi:hypothetical protein
VVDFVRASAARVPLLLIVDDLQWADPSTLELIGRVVGAKVPGLLLVMTAREGFAAPWSSITRLGLERMSRAELDELAQRLPEGRHLGRPVLDEAIERSDGIPFFLEELLRSSALAQVQIDDRGAAIPAALRDLLLARFASPGVDLHLAQLLATIGGEATAPVAAAVCGVDLAAIEARLAPLVDADILAYLPGEPPSYRFKHHLLADLAYDTQLRPARERAHAAVADALRSGVSVGVAAAPAVVAFHHERGHQLPAAHTPLTEAAQEAHELGANSEVATLVAHGLELVAKLPAAEGRDLELHLRLLRAGNVSSQLGYAAPQAVEDYTIANGLIADAQPDGFLDDLTVGEPEFTAGSQWVSSVTGLWAALMLQARLDECDVINERLRTRFRPGSAAQQYSESAGLSMSAFFRGDYARTTALAREFVERATVYELPGPTSMPNDARSSGNAHLAYALAVQGHFDDARAELLAGLELAEAHPFPIGPFSVCYLLGVTASVEITCGDLDSAARAAARQRELAERHGLTFWALISSLHGSIAAYAQGDDQAGQQALMTVQMLKAVGMLVWMPSFLGLLAAVQVARGDVSGAAASASDGLGIADEHGAHYWTADLHRLRGEARFGQGDGDGLHEIDDAVQLAVEASAGLHELWARTALVRLRGGDDDRRGLEDLLTRIPVPAGAPARLAAEAALAG